MNMRILPWRSRNGLVLSIFTIAWTKVRGQIDFAKFNMVVLVKEVKTTATSLVASEMQLGMPDTGPWNLHIGSIDTDFSIEIKSPSWDIDILSGLFGFINRIIEDLAVISIIVWRSSFRNNIDSIVPLSNRVWSLLEFHKVKAVMDVVWPVFH